jgi:hypothetical protein
MTGLQLLFSNQDVLPGKKGVKTVLFDKTSLISSFYTYSPEEVW